MIKFLTSLSFLYAFAIATLLLYGWFYYRSFVRNRFQKKRFPVVFGLIGVACFAFLLINMHAPLSLKTFSNLDHHFIQLDGFRVAGHIELGKSDTVNYKTNTFNRYILSRKAQSVNIESPYSEEPLYGGAGSGFKILSVCYPATQHQIAFSANGQTYFIHAINDSLFEFKNEQNVIGHVSRSVAKGATAWSLLKDDVEFINQPDFTNETVVNALKNIFILRDDVSRNGGKELRYFISGKLFSVVHDVYYDSKKISVSDLAFQATMAGKDQLAWGVGFLDNNRNQYKIQLAGNDSFYLWNRYPVSYPLTEEDKEDWGAHRVNKFLVSGQADMQEMPSLFAEGFLFSPFAQDHSLDFSPLLLSYSKGASDRPLQMQARFMNGDPRTVNISGNKLLLPSKDAGFSWMFSIKNSFDWKLGKWSLASNQWQMLILASLGFYFLMIFLLACFRPASQQSWIWQLLSSITLVLLTTRFFLYWRYKSFPPFDGLDLPSQQQLNSPWNFGIIIFASVVLGLIFGSGLFNYLFRFTGKLGGKLIGKKEVRTPSLNISENKISEKISSSGLARKTGIRNFYFLSWITILLGTGGFAAINHFDPTICRHLALGLILCYFVFLYISYKFSPLVISSEKSWWAIRTGSSLDLLINNPVKVLLSVSLLALFAFIDIGFAIIFLNFLLFNEAFLCINYAIAGLSAGSKKNASFFGFIGILYLLAFTLNLVYGPYVFNFLLNLSDFFYLLGYIVFSLLIGYMIVRLAFRLKLSKRLLTGFVSACLLFMMAFLFFPREKILEKAAITKYRIDVMTMPVEKAIETAYEEGKTYEPVIRAAQNQWFINTFIFEENNPSVQNAGFHLLPHAPQSKGARYNAQATDLVASRFLIAEHGKWSVLLYVLLLLVPIVLLASFYKLYPDFTNRINSNYPTITTGFSLLNYLLISALLVILAATGRYIFFGQDLPFGSILSKQSVLFPSLVIVIVVVLFKKIPLEQYPNRKKLLPGAIVFCGLALLLFLVKPAFNKDREFNASGIAKEMDNFIESRLQPVFDYIDSSEKTRKLSWARKDRLFSDTLKQLLATGYMADAGKFFETELANYAKSDFSRHLDQRKLLYLDLYSGRPQLAVNDNYFHVDPPPHLRQLWTGNVFSDTNTFNITCWNAAGSAVSEYRFMNYSGQQNNRIDQDLSFVFTSVGEGLYCKPVLVNTSKRSFSIISGTKQLELKAGDSLSVSNPSRLRITESNGSEKWVVIEPDAFMKNYFVNGNRFYVYPMGSDFIWARNFAETVSSEFASKKQMSQNAFISLDAVLNDSLTTRIRQMISLDTSYKKSAEYGITIADGNGRLIAMADFIKGLDRPDPNDKAAFNKAIRGENGFISQSLLRKEIGNINLLRMNPGPGSTLKPIVFSAIASQLKMDWDRFAAEGFSQKQQYFGGEKVAEYDFEKNNGRISSVVDYLRYSDNYYHSNLILLGSYSKQSLQSLLARYFATRNPEAGFHWPYFSYDGKQYWLNGFEHWPGYADGKANFGSDSSFLSVGLYNNFGIYTYRQGKTSESFPTAFDSTLFDRAASKSGFILPEYSLFDQKGTGMDNRKPNEVFMSSFRGHVKGSSQVMIPPVKMVDGFGKMVTQNKNYSITLNPYAKEPAFAAFDVDGGVSYNNYLSIMKEKVFKGLEQVLVNGTATRLGNLIKKDSKYYYYAKTGTTGDDEVKAKSKLFAIVISKKDLTDPDFNFRKNRFFTIYFTSQNGPAKQNEDFQAAIIKYVENSEVFKRYMR